MMKICFLFLLAGLAVPAAHGGERPNVLLLLVDDLKPAIRAYGDPIAKTPHLDALAARGMRFDAAYCNQAVCAPSRFTLMLGAHSTTTGLYGLGSQLRKALPDAVTMPQYFAKHGYRTESLGKIFHIGHGNKGDPDSFSVPHFKEKVIEYVDPASTPGGKLTREEALFGNHRHPNNNSLPRGAAFESPDVEDDAYADGRVANETITRLEAAKNRDEPFFIAAGFARPHLPFSAPKQYWDLYDPDQFSLPECTDLPKGAPAVAGKRGGEIRNYFPVPDKGSPEQISSSLARQLIHGYYASTSYVDAQIGKVLAKLNELRLSDQTIVVLWGDHGFHLGDLGIWTKHTNYEQANRIPLIFAGPGISPGKVTRQPAGSVDVFPTLAELAGLPSPAVPQRIDGLSLGPVLKDPDQRVRDHTFHAYPKRTMGRAIRTERYRLVEWKKPGADPGSAEWELYDYEADPLETKNLASEKPEVVATLRKILATYPEAVSRNSSRQKRRATVTPNVINHTIAITAEVTGTNLTGVVLAHGGNQHGYALYFTEGHPVLGVRRDGTLTTLRYNQPVSGKVRLSATVDSETLTLTANGRGSVSKQSPGLLQKQPLDPLSVGEDVQSAAGGYASPNPFSGKILSQKVVTVPWDDETAIKEAPGQ